MAATTAQFAVNVQVLPPAGCVTAVASTGGSGPVVTLTCGSNLFVNVQPTIVTPPVATPSSSTNNAFTATFGGVTTGNSAQPPTELPQTSISNLMNLNDSATSAVSGALFVQRRAAPAPNAAPAEAGGTAPGASTSVLSLEPGPGIELGSNTLGQRSQSVEMWLIF